MNGDFAGLPPPEVPGYIPQYKLDKAGRAWKALELTTGEHRVLKIAGDCPVERHTLFDESDAIDAVHRRHAERTGESFAPDIVRSYGIIGSYESPCLVLEHLKPARRMLRPTAPTVDILYAGILVSDALARVHKAGYYFNDIKPANIIEHASQLSEPAQMKLIDFGGAMPRGEDWRFVYTLGYASPDRLRGRVDPRGDVYGLGAILLKLVSGREPYSTEGVVLQTPADRVKFAATIQPVTLDRVAPQHRPFPKPAREIIEAMLSPDSSSVPSLLESRNGLEAAVRELDSDVAAAIPPPPLAQRTNA